MDSPFNSTAAVTETYVYAARQGRASSRTTQMIYNGKPSEAFTQSWSWNVEQTAKQVFGRAYDDAHISGTRAQNSVSGFTRGRTNDDLLDDNTGNGYTLTEQVQGRQTVSVIIKWVNGNIVKVVRK